MNYFQRIILLVGLLAIAGFCLRPPYQWEVTTYDVGGGKVETITQDARHYWIWSPPDGNVRQGYLVGATVKSRVARIDWQRLSIYTAHSSRRVSNLRGFIMVAFLMCRNILGGIGNNFMRQPPPRQ